MDCCQVEIGSMTDARSPCLETQVSFGGPEPTEDAEGRNAGSPKEAGTTDSTDSTDLPLAAHLHWH